MSSQTENNFPRMECDGNVCRIIHEMPVREQPVQEQPVQEQPVQERPVQEQPVQEQTCTYLPINTQVEPLPERFHRYRHGSHCHKLFLIKCGSVHGNNCDNRLCRRIMVMGESMLRCFKCNFDLCTYCYHLRPECEIPLSQDDEKISEEVMETFKVRV
jgi:hypothetical protein